MNYFQIVLNAAKAHLENEIDAEKKLVLEEAIKHFEQQNETRVNNKQTVR